MHFFRELRGFRRLARGRRQMRQSGIEPGSFRPRVKRPHSRSRCLRGSADPVPGGCNTAFDLPADPNLYVRYDLYETTVRFAPAGVGHGRYGETPQQGQGSKRSRPSSHFELINSSLLPLLPPSRPGAPPPRRAMSPRRRTSAAASSTTCIATSCRRATNQRRASLAACRAWPPLRT